LAIDNNDLITDIKRWLNPLDNSQWLHRNKEIEGKTKENIFSENDTL